MAESTKRNDAVPKEGLSQGFVSNGTECARFLNKVENLKRRGVRAVSYDEFRAMANHRIECMRTHP
jgi:hypothetical protein